MCQFMYIGETSINAYTRGKEHIDLYNTLLSKPPKSDDDTASVLFKNKQPHGTGITNFQKCQSQVDTTPH